MHIEKRRLKLVDKNLIIKLLTHPLVKRHMPLSAESFDEKNYYEFIASKEAIWEKFGFGPYAYFVKNEFVGWGGIQPDEEDFELALVLDPAHWGYGRQLYNDLIHQAFVELNLDSVTILFPPSRTRIKGILKLGFVEEGRLNIEGECFIRFRLMNPKLNE
jgi:ribosomal-protein-alanine N-acetyltransferase